MIASLVALIVGLLSRTVKSSGGIRACLILNMIIPLPADDVYRAFRYFRAFPETVLEGFFSSFEKWELSGIIDDIGMADTPTSIRAGTLYRMMSNWAFFSDTRVQSYLQNRVPPNPLPGWPEHSPPRFAFVLSVMEGPNLQAWGKMCLSRCVIISKDLLVDFYSRALSIVIGVLEQPPARLSFDGTNHAESNTPNLVQFAEHSELWSGVYSIVRLIPPEWFQVNVGESLKLRRMILSHLRDPSPG